MIEKALVTLIFCPLLFGQEKQTPTLRSLLQEQLKSTHSQEDWFVPVMDAVKGMSAEQAAWKDASSNHSVGQLVNHLLFWNSRILTSMDGSKQDPFKGNNDETFNAFDAKLWKETIQKLDGVLKEFEKLADTASEEGLKKMANAMAHVGTHNAYHTGQIIAVRRAQGSWPLPKPGK